MAAMCPSWTATSRGASSPDAGSSTMPPAMSRSTVSFTGASIPLGAPSQLAEEATDGVGKGPRLLEVRQVRGGRDDLQARLGDRSRVGFAHRQRHYTVVLSP